jgi:hydroxymethylbilane synthase
MPPQLRIATRKSKLALWQAEHVRDLLSHAHPQLEISLVPMSTRGDRILDRSLASIGGKGLFIKELESAIEGRKADIAVHSMKDVPADLPPSLTIGALLPRADTRDAFVSNRYSSLQELPAGGTVGTSSLRRRAQLLALRPDLRIADLRGNVDTRLRRLDDGELDAIILASAGLIRLGWESRITAHLSFDVCLPAPGQGAIGIECRRDDTGVRTILQGLDHEPTRLALTAERAFAQRLGGNCQSPIAALARIEQGRLKLAGLIAEPNGSQVLHDDIEGISAAAHALGLELADRMLRSGGRALLDGLRIPR